MAALVVTTRSRATDTPALPDSTNRPHRTEFTFHPAAASAEIVVQFVAGRLAAGDARSKTAVDHWHQTRGLRFTRASLDVSLRTLPLRHLKPPYLRDSCADSRLFSATQRGGLSAGLDGAHQWLVCAAQYRCQLWVKYWLEVAPKMLPLPV